MKITKIKVLFSSFIVLSLFLTRTGLPVVNAEESVSPDLTSANQTLPEATMTGSYSQQVSGSVSAATPQDLSSNWAVVKGYLPLGLALDPSTGIISGMPSECGNFSFTVQSNSSSNKSVVRNLSLKVEQVPSITTDAFSSGKIGSQYSQKMEISGGAAPLKWYVNFGFLPAGLSLDKATGVISGTPTMVQNSNFTIEAMDPNGLTALKNFRLQIDK